MTDDKNALYQIRNQFHEIEGKYSESELLQRITKGKYTGLEEVAHPPYYEWQKLSSHPVFYDAFLRRLFEQQYKIAPIVRPEDSKPVGTSNRKHVREQETHKGEKSQRIENRGTERLAPDHVPLVPATEQLNLERGLVPDGTFHQTDIDKLFEDGSDARLAKEVTSSPVDPLAFPLNESASDEEGSISRPVVLPPLVFSDPYPPTPPPASERRRFLLFGTVLAGLLILLFQMGQEKKQPEIISGANVNVKSFTLNLEKENLSAQNRQEIINALLDEGQSFYWMDTPLHYDGALSVFREVAYLTEKDAHTQAKIALAAARLLEEAPNSQKMIEEMKHAIAIGRETEPHFSAFYRAEAIAAFYQKKLEVAKEKLLEAQESDPSDAENLLLAAEMLNASGDRLEAKQAVTQVLASMPESVRAHFIAAQIHLDMGELEAAKTEVEEVVKLNPLHANSYSVLAEVFFKAGRPTEAKVFFDLTAKLAPLGLAKVIADSEFSIAKILESEGNIAEAKKRLGLAWYYSKGVLPGLSEKMKSVKAEEADLKRQAQEAVYDRSYYETRGQELIAENNPALALKFYQTVRLLNPDEAAALVKVGEVLEKLAVSYEDFRRVMLVYQRAIDKDSKSVEAYLKLGMLETEQYNFDRGFKLLTQAEGLSQDNPLVYVALGKHFYKRQDYERARDLFVRAAKVNSTDSEVYYYYGLLTRVYKKDMLQEAMGLFYQAYTLDSQNYDALAEWIKLKVLTFEKNFAVKYLRSLLETDPKNAQLYWIMGELYATNKEFRRAISFYHKALDRDNRLAKVRMSLARALVAIGEMEAAVDEYIVAAKLDRRNGEGFFQAAGLLIEMKNPNGAEEILQNLILSTPNYPGSHRELSRVYQAKQKKDLAVAEMVKEVENNPMNAKFIIELAELYMAYSNFPEAIKTLVRVTNLPSESKAPAFRGDRIRAFLLLSRCYRSESKAENAEGAIKLALNIDPNDPELHREMGYVYHALQRDREGVKEFEIYLQRNPAARDAEAVREMMKHMMIEE